MNSLVLGGILKRVYDKFSMRFFSNRLKLQKIIYLLQQSGINLGYSYSFYIYGPYCTELTRDAFNITDFSEVKEVGFEDKMLEEKFSNFLAKIQKYKNNELWLEIASSIHLMKELYPSKSKDEIVKSIQNKRKQLEEKRNYIEKVWEDIEGWLI